MTEQHRETPLYLGAAKAGMSENTARKYLRGGALPSQIKVVHDWRTRKDPFENVDAQIDKLIAAQPNLRATTILEHLQREHPGEYGDNLLRSLQRRLRTRRATNGSPKEVYFAQQHMPGDLAQSDFCHMGQMGITIAGSHFDHMLYHFTLTYSNWEHASICLSESFESLSEGLQNALWSLGAVPRLHRTDSLTAAVNKKCSREEFTARYQALMRHYAMTAQHTQPRRPNENGDVEQSHFRLRDRLDQTLMLRGSRDFASRADYDRFLKEQCNLANARRQERFTQEHSALQPLPIRKLDACKYLEVRVGPGSTISVQNNTYSVHSRLIGERVKVRLGSEQIDVLYAQRVVEQLPRLRGRGNHRIDYRHVIDWLVRKPGAFEHYVYRSDLFPTSQFRAAYDQLIDGRPHDGTKDYLAVLQLAAREGQDRVEDALRTLLPKQRIRLDEIALAVRSDPGTPAYDVRIAPVDLQSYDLLLGSSYDLLLESAVAMPPADHDVCSIQCSVQEVCCD